MTLRQDEMPGLNRLRISHSQMLKDYFSKYPRENCDYTITNVIAWGMVYDNHFLIYKERLVIFNPQYQYILYPVGEELAPSELRDLVLEFRPWYPKAEIILLPPSYIRKHPKLKEYFELKKDRDWADYIYSSQSMVELRGKKLRKKRNLISQFRRAWPHYQVLEIAPKHLDMIMDFTHKWRRERDAEGSYLMTEFKAIENTLKLWSKLPVEGIIICLNRRIVGYCIFSEQTPDMVTVHFEKFDPDKKGSAQLVTWEAARFLQRRYKWINREQDIGLPGLRQAKLSYVPDRLVPFFGSKLRSDSK